MSRKSRRHNTLVSLNYPESTAVGTASGFTDISDFQSDSSTQPLFAPTSYRPTNIWSDIAPFDLNVAVNCSPGDAVLSISSLARSSTTTTPKPEKSGKLLNERIEPRKTRGKKINFTEIDPETEHSEAEEKQVSSSKKKRKKENGNYTPPESATNTNVFFPRTRNNNTDDSEGKLTFNLVTLRVESDAERKGKKRQKKVPPKQGGKKYIFERNPFKGGGGFRTPKSNVFMHSLFFNKGRIYETPTAAHTRFTKTS